MTDAPDTITIANVDQCARCAGTHKGVVFSKLQYPIATGDDVWHYWAPCPINKEPILLYASISIEEYAGQ